MRIRIDIVTNGLRIPYSHQHLLTGVIHKWLGSNELHGNISLYSFSRLEGAKSTKDGLQFGNNGSFWFSAHDPGVVNALIKGIFKDKTMFGGLTVREISVVEEPDFSNSSEVYFYPGSPILVKRPFENSTKHYIYTDECADLYLKETLLHKMQVAGIEDDTLDIRFDRQCGNASTKLVDYDGIKNRASWCPVIVKGMPETILFAWNVGLGNSTGIGFGAVK